LNSPNVLCEVFECVGGSVIVVPTEAKSLHPLAPIEAKVLCPQRQKFCTYRGKIFAPTSVFKAGTIISACKPFQIMKIKNDSNFAPIGLSGRRHNQCMQANSSNYEV